MTAEVSKINSQNQKKWDIFTPNTNAQLLNPTELLAS